MYAVLVTGGKQYRVMQGETLRVELLDVEAVKEITFDNVLMLGDSDGIKVGDALKGATVTATVKAHISIARRGPPCRRPMSKVTRMCSPFFRVCARARKPAAAML